MTDKRMLDPEDVALALGVSVVTMKLALAIASIWLFAAKSTALVTWWHVTGRRP